MRIEQEFTVRIETFNNDKPQLYKVMAINASEALRKFNGLQGYKEVINRKGVALNPLLEG